MITRQIPRTKAALPPRGLGTWQAFDVQPSGEPRCADVVRDFTRARRIDLMQIHNLLDWQTHLPILRAMKQKGTIRYLGVTHDSHQELPQIPYNMIDRAAEQHISPTAAR